MGKLVYDDLSGVTYLDLAGLDGRVPVLFPFWDGQLWSLWVPTGRTIHAAPSRGCSCDGIRRQTGSEVY
jgi:hypothetical protein